MTLSPSQLADLVNYVLQLPVRGLNRTIVEPAIHPCAVSTWPRKSKHRNELWCDELLAEAGIGPREKENKNGAGCLRCATPELRRIAPKPVGRVEQMRKCWRVVA